MLRHSHSAYTSAAILLLFTLAYSLSRVYTRKSLRSVCVCACKLQLANNVLRFKVNTMAANLTGQVRAIAEVTTAVAKGDLTKKISVDVKGTITLDVSAFSITQFANACVLR